MFQSPKGSRQMEKLKIVFPKISCDFKLLLSLRLLVFSLRESFMIYVNRSLLISCRSTNEKKPEINSEIQLFSSNQFFDFFVAKNKRFSFSDERKCGDNDKKILFNWSDKGWEGATCQAQQGKILQSRQTNNVYDAVCVKRPSNSGICRKENIKVYFPLFQVLKCLRQPWFHHLQ